MRILMDDLHIIKGVYNLVSSVIKSTHGLITVRFFFVFFIQFFVPFKIISGHMTRANQYMGTPAIRTWLVSHVASEVG